MSAADDQREADNKQAVLDIFARNLRRWRQERGLSLKALAKKSGVSETSLLSYEQTRKVAGIDKLMALAEALDVTVSDLLDDGGDVTEQRLWRCTRIAEGLGLFISVVGTARIIISESRPAPGVEYVVLDKSDFVYKMEMLINYAMTNPSLRKVARYAFFGGEESE